MCLLVTPREWYLDNISNLVDFRKIIIGGFGSGGQPYELEFNHEPTNKQSLSAVASVI
jgi:hypothetical protein